LIGSHGPTANIDGITTRYGVVGSGQPELMFEPGGFDASLEQWTTLGVHARTKTKLLELLSEGTCASSSLGGHLKTGQ